MIRISIIVYSLIVLTSSCSDEVKLNKNPFDENSTNTGNTELDTNTYDANEIFSIHRDIFQPTCANSGCHDGNFEPDFRSVESSYYSLVNSPVTKEDANGGFDLRVKPNDADNSMLIRRLLVDLNGNSGIMPLGLEADSDYPANKEDYINRIKTWINTGAKDMYGNAVGSGNFPPVCDGVRVEQNGVKTPRIGIYEPVTVDPSKGVKLLFALSDKESSSNLKVLSYQMSTAPDSFEFASPEAVNQMATPIQDKGLFGNTVNYGWDANIQLDTAKPLDVYWFRIKVTDGTDTLYLPSISSMFSLKKYFAIRVQ